MLLLTCCSASALRTRRQDVREQQAGLGQGETCRA